MLSHKQLLIFAAIAQHGSITKASEALYLTQPALSSALSRLENELGVKLFDRLDRKIILNHNGERIYPKIKQLLEKTHKIQHFFNHARALTGTIHIGASNTIGNYILPPLMTRFKQKHSETQLSLSISNSAQVIEQVLQHQVDIGFIETPCLHNQINSFPFAKDKLVLFTDKAHPLTHVSEAKLEKLDKYPFIVREKGSGTRAIVEQVLFPLLKYQVDVFLELGSNEAICLAIKNSLAIGCVSASSLQNQSHFHILNFSEFELTRDFLIIQNKRAHISELTEEWLDWVIHK